MARTLDQQEPLHGLLFSVCGSSLSPTHIRISPGEGKVLSASRIHCFPSTTLCPSCLHGIFDDDVMSPQLMQDDIALSLDFHAQFRCQSTLRKAWKCSTATEWIALSRICLDGTSLRSSSRGLKPLQDVYVGEVVLAQCWYVVVDSLVVLRALPPHFHSAIQSFRIETIKTTPRSRDSPIKATRTVSTGRPTL